MNELTHDWSERPRTRLRGRLSVRTGNRKLGDPDASNDDREPGE